MLFTHVSQNRSIRMTKPPTVLIAWCGEIIANQQRCTMIYIPILGPTCDVP